MLFFILLNIQDIKNVLYKEPFFLLNTWLISAGNDDCSNMDTHKFITGTSSVL
jgi:hypothetical protein